MGRVDDGYIAQISHEELEKTMDRHYGSRMNTLRVGETATVLSDGYDFREDIQQACKAMVDSINTFKRVQSSLFNLAEIIAHLPTEDES